MNSLEAYSAVQAREYGRVKEEKISVDVNVNDNSMKWHSEEYVRRCCTPTDENVAVARACGVQLRAEVVIYRGQIHVSWRAPGVRTR